MLASPPTPTPTCTPTPVGGHVTVNGDSIKQFEDFWSNYPRKVKRLEAERAFVEINGYKFINDILSALRRQKSEDDWTKEGGKFVPSPDNYLRDGRWMDEPKKKTVPCPF
jgi:hypothetical protein